MAQLSPEARAIVKEARRLIAEVGWTQGAYARDVHGDPISDSDPAAACYCMSGAIWGASFRSGFERSADDVDESVHEARAAVGQAADEAAGQSYGMLCFNDALGRTRGEVLAVFDKVLAA